ncbi:pheromone autoinducer 2 transporter [compost metagenome]
MENSRNWPDRFKLFFLNNRFVLFLLILLLIGLNIMILDKISYVFTPFLVLLKTILLPIILTGVVFYLLNPIVNLLEQKNVKRIYSILILYLLIIAILTLLILTVIPLIREQILSLINNFPTYSQEIETRFEQLVGGDFFNRIQQTSGINSDELIKDISEKATAILQNVWTRLGGFVGAVSETLLAIVTVPFILFYLLKDGKKLGPFILGFVPTSLSEQTKKVMAEMNHQISSYIRGQIVISFCIGLLLYIGYLIIGLEYSLVLAVIAACTSIVPYLGPVIAITPALIVAMVTSPVMLLKMVAVWTIVQLIEGKFISPQIMGRTLQIHPITIIFVILTAGNLFGVAGIILAVPGYAVIKVIASHLFQWFKFRSRLYEPKEPFS